MSYTVTPLRYPGGKTALSTYFAHLIEYNGVSKCTYVEPFAGGAGAALKLLCEQRVDKLVLNDADPAIYAFWAAILRQPDAFIRLVEGTPVTIDNWKRQRAIYRDPHSHSILELGFSTFYLNRCNRSGIIGNGSAIGGLAQEGPWRIDARFNKETQIKRIELIAKKSKEISVYNLDALAFLKKHIVHAPDTDNFFIYLDPPYFVKGSRLYLNKFSADDHLELSRFLKTIRSLKWILSYDNAPEIREHYKWAPHKYFSLRYSAQHVRIASELMIYSSSLKRPPTEAHLQCA